MVLVPALMNLDERKYDLQDEAEARE